LFQGKEVFMKINIRRWGWLIGRTDKEIRKFEDGWVFGIVMTHLAWVLFLSLIGCYGVSLIKLCQGT
jgi:hypothetical protein